jgi:hypothetical protein
MLYQISSEQSGNLHSNLMGDQILKCKITGKISSVY